MDSLMPFRSGATAAGSKPLPPVAHENREGVGLDLGINGDEVDARTIWRN